jgi:hypothetical protein
MKLLTWMIVLLTASICSAQVQLDSKNFENLVSIAELYSKGGSPSEYSGSIESMRTARLNSIVDTLLALGRKDGTILQSKFLNRPDDDDLAFWYVIREIHYNRTSDTKQPRPNKEVAKEILSKKIDNRWLVDNYYYRIRGGIASYFNDADLSKVDIKIDQLGLRDKTEKAIFFFNAMEALAGGRFMVLMMTGNDKKILEFSDRLPKFNGRPYYYYNDFDYSDFDWIGYEKVEKYNQRHFERLYITLMAHYEAESKTRNKKGADEIFSNSILKEPKYFRFSGMSNRLENLYNSKK